MFRLDGETGRSKQYVYEGDLLLVMGAGCIGYVLSASLF